jgi:3-oxoacyl-[acyl-carrier-protein] synthase II
MKSRRVVVTGMGGLCALGDDWKTVKEGLQTGRTGVERVPTLGEIEGMDTRLAARLHGFEAPAHYARKKTRSMGRVSLLAARATELALRDAGLLDDPTLHDGTVGISYGSTSGSPPAIEVYARALWHGRTLRGIRATDYVQFMSHTVAANIAQLFEVRGRVVPTCSACTSGSQGVGYAYEMIQSGKQDVMIAGGAEEYHEMDVAVFDIMYATSTRNDAPDTTPRPFDAARDGLVVGEGAATLILEDAERALARGAPIYAEIVGFGTNCDGAHITHPAQEGMRRVMELALADAGLPASAIDYLNAHGTATDAGDIAESQATAQVFGDTVPVSTLKGHIGHTLGACGAIEAWCTIEMMRDGWIAPTRNLENVDPRCGALDYVIGSGRTRDICYAATQNFAFGGINTSLIFARFER